VRLAVLYVEKEICEVIGWRKLLLCCLVGA